MTAARRCRPAEGERGATLVFFSLLLFSMLAAAALVVDLGQARATQRTNQSIADLAALAAGGKLSETGATPRDACLAAFAYVRANAGDLPPGASMAGGCASMPLTCDDGNPPAPVVATATGAGPYAVAVSYPVGAAEIAIGGFAGGAGSRDGLPCQRMKVTVRKTQQTFFAGVLGTKELSASGSAVVRRQGGRSAQVPALWLLDPEDCTSLSVTGGATLQVGAPPEVPGLVTIDSDGSQCGGAYTVAVGGSGTRLRAIPVSGTDAGRISLFALPDSAAACVGSACNPTDVTAGLIAPQPVSQQPARATRSPVDHRFNCKRGTGGVGAYPVYREVVTIPDCPYASTTPPFIDQLRAAVGTSGAPANFTNTVSGGACNPNGNVTYAGNTWVNCSTFRLSGNGPCGGPCVRFQGNVVFQGDVTINSGVMEVNTANVAASTVNNLAAIPSSCLATLAGDCTRYSSPSAAYAYFRGGNLSVTSGQLTLNKTAVYQASGYVKITGGSPPVWVGPSEGPLNGLALWSEENTSQFTVNGGGSLRLGGLFFTPEASPFKITGGAPTDQFRAQFVSAQMSVSGSGLLSMAPDPNQSVTLPPPAAYLVR